MISDLCIYNVSLAYFARYICVSVINIHFFNPTFKAFLNPKQAGREGGGRNPPTGWLFPLLC